MTEYALLAASAMVSAAVNARGALLRAGRGGGGGHDGGGEGPERILVVKLDHPGDVVLATPAIRALRDSHPEAVIDALVAPGSAFVLARSPAVNRTLAYDSPRFRRARPGGTAAANARAEGASGEARGTRALPLHEIVRNHYDVIVELRGDVPTLRLPFRTGARRRVDRGTVRLRDWIARRLPGDRERPPLHEIETNLEIVRPLLTPEIRERVRDATPECAPLEVHADPAADRTLARKLGSAGVKLEEPIVCVHPGASWRPRAWDPKRFAAVADWMQSHYHAQVVFTGSEDERDIEASVRESTKGGRSFWLAGAITWDELHALLVRSRLFLGNDSGPAHLAAAAGTPSVVLFGPQDPRRFGPWSARTIVLHHRAPCWPCAQTRCVRPENPCVNDIQVSEVTAAIARLLDVPARAAAIASRRAPGSESP